MKMSDRSGRWLYLLLTSLAFCATEVVVDQTSVLSARFQGSAKACEDGTDQTCLDFSSVQSNSLSVAHFWFGAVGAPCMGLLTGKVGVYGASWMSALLLLVGIDANRPRSVRNGIFRQYVISHQVKSHWFSGKELAPSFAIYITSCHLGAVITFAAVGVIVTRLGLQITLWVTFSIGLFGVSCAVTAGWVHRRYGTSTAEYSSADWNLGKVFLLGRDFCIVCGIIFFFFSVFFTYLIDGSKYLQDVYGYSEAAAGQAVGAIPDCTLFTPTIALLVDRYGKRTSFITVALTMIVIGFLVQFFSASYFAGIVGVLVGGAYTVMVSSTWSSIPILTEPDTVGLAMGIALGAQAFGTGLTPLITGFLLDNTSIGAASRWTTFFVIMVSFSVVAWILSLILLFFDFKFEHRRLHTKHNLPAMAAERNKEVGEITPLLK